ncbi:MAG: putative bifunctional diguanylate cyclase/phosphodiesterase [Burkholderiales bacterium]
MHFNRNSRAQKTPDELRVLVVQGSEDETRPFILELEESGLAVVHHRVHTAAEMRRALLEAEWHLVITRQGMPGLSARAALGVLKSTGRDIPFVVHSGGAASRGRFARLFDREARERIDEAHRPGIREFKDMDGGAHHASAAIAPPAEHDPLTGLETRELFMRQARGLLAQNGSAHRAVVCFIDFARFLRLNQAFGYDAGDALLVQAGARLAHCGRAGIAARFGGDEFVLMQGGLGDDEAVQRFVEELSTVLAAPFTYAAMELHVATSIGVSVFPGGGRTVPELVINAETALYQCKRLMSRNAYLYFFPDLHPVPADQTLLESALCVALQRDELRLYYQPCIALATGRVTLVEALLRWHHPELGLLSPDRFIALAAECGLAGELDAWVLREACRQIAAWRSAGYPDLSVSVNVSPGEFVHPRLLGRTAMALRESGVGVDTLEIEITEQALVLDAATTLSTLTSLRKMGVRIAIDDFGTGYSSLAYLKRYPLDVLKIDKTFVRNIHLAREDAAIARTIIELARNLNLQVHAEGIETQQQLDFLRAHGCDRGQGYLFGRPVAAGDLLPLLRELDARAGRYVRCANVEP